MNQMRKFLEQFKADYAHVTQLGAARKAAALRRGDVATTTTTSARTVEAWAFPSLATETADDRKAIARVRALQNAERLYAGVLGRIVRLDEAVKAVASNGAARQTAIA